MVIKHNVESYRMNQPPSLRIRSPLVPSPLLAAVDSFPSPLFAAFGLRNRSLPLGKDRFGTTIPRKEIDTEDQPSISPLARKDVVSTKSSTSLLWALGMKVVNVYRPDNYDIAMLGHAEEHETTVLELIYKHGVTEYTKGNGYAQVAIGTDDVLVYKSSEVGNIVTQELGGTITRQPGPIPGINTKITSFLDPDGWKIVRIVSSCLVFLLTCMCDLFHYLMFMCINKLKQRNMKVMSKVYLSQLVTFNYSYFATCQIND